MARQNKRAARQIEMPISYPMELTGWHWEYDFGLNADFSYEDDPYREHRHLQLDGRLIHPPDIKEKSMQITIIPDKQLNLSNRKKLRPIAMGQLSSREDYIDGIFSLPLNMLPSILTALTAKHFNYAEFIGTKMRYRRSNIRSYRLMPSYDSDEYEHDPL